MLIGPVEQQRRDDRAEQAAEHAAERHGEIEAGEMADRGPQPEHLGMERDRDRRTAAAGRGSPRRTDCAVPSLKARPPAIRMISGASMVMKLAGPRRRGEGDDEAQQIEAERQHPEQGHGDDVGGEVGRRRQHQPRRHRGERDPVERSAAASAAASVSSGTASTACGRHGQRAGDDEQDQQRVDGRSTASSAAAGVISGSTSKG